MDHNTRGIFSKYSDLHSLYIYEYVNGLVVACVIKYTSYLPMIVDYAHWEHDFVFRLKLNAKR